MMSSHMGQIVTMVWLSFWVNSLFSLFFFFPLQFPSSFQTVTDKLWISRWGLELMRSVEKYYQVYLQVHVLPDDMKMGVV